MEAELSTEDSNAVVEKDRVVRGFRYDKGLALPQQTHRGRSPGSVTPQLLPSGWHTFSKPQCPWT